MTRPPDMLRFFDPRLPGGSYAVGWTGPWPPPERMTIARGNRTGICKVCETAALDDGSLGVTREELNDGGTIDVIDFTLRNASQLPDDFESEHVFRGAEYVAELVTA